jgi:hypothetical protein
MSCRVRYSKAYCAFVIFCKHLLNYPVSVEIATDILLQAGKENRKIKIRRQKTNLGNIEMKNYQQWPS